MNTICTFCSCVIWSSCYYRWTHCLSLCVVQVFGDYYHFRHHAVEKRALSGHRGIHIRLQKEPQVRLLSALTQLIAVLHVGNKRPKDRLDYQQKSAYISQEKGMPASMITCQMLYSLQSTLIVPSVLLTSVELLQNHMPKTKTLL